MQIYCFSGTGNSLTAARDIADALGAALADIASLPHGTVGTDAAVIGIVCPVYFEELPAIVREFAQRLKARGDAYIFAVLTYGGAAGAAVGQLRRGLKRAGLKLSAAYGVPMPQNTFNKPGENRNKLAQAWQKRLPVIVRRTRARARGMRFFNLPLEALIILLYRVWIKSAVSKQLSRLSGLPVGVPTDALIRHADSSYYADSGCTGCGMCKRLCPVGNIRLAGKTPVWQHRCELCGRCYHMCPARAIHGGVVQPGFYYTSAGMQREDLSCTRANGAV
jgi:ferredoxin